MTNAERNAACAETALIMYARESGFEDGMEAAANFLADLRHWCDINNYDFAALSDDGYKRYLGDKEQS